VTHIEANSDSFLGFSSARTVHRELVYRAFQFHEGSQYFIGTDDEALSVAVRISNPIGTAK